MEAVGVTAAATFLLLLEFRINLLSGPLVTSGKSAFGSCERMSAVSSVRRSPRVIYGSTGVSYRWLDSARSLLQMYGFTFW